MHGKYYLSLSFIPITSYHYVELPCLRCKGLWKRQKNAPVKFKCSAECSLCEHEPRSFTQEVHGAMHELHHAKHGQRFRLCRRRTNDPDQWTSTKCALGQGCWHTARDCVTTLGKTIEKCGILMHFIYNAKGIVNTRLQHRFCSGTWWMAWKKKSRSEGHAANVAVGRSCRGKSHVKPRAKACKLKPFCFSSYTSKMQQKGLVEATIENWFQQSQKSYHRCEHGFSMF